ncbi:hypothetical protein AMTRI_Chr02g223660 [Amborella trichopoda]|uniref:PPM-type phosphatase domain-containing protein n=1 Tax=Amborella trichopoda TaxID=13333 RepID=W1NWT1_AMBTC|nr:protein phosphatase 2C 32 [Amborella trichopoda]XP_020520556.1 protein phosphatase 2C 32 [Amborella trichopoda]ERN02092.1 hypothetical protein AMTR_s00045p00156730 [Amborella trichopoda]|eukprot:XP_006840417.1 protein phosphatase 2C 32 [Amborella trichopoda]
MGNSTSRVVGCFVPVGNSKEGVDLDFLEPLDEGLGHSFCYVRPVSESSAITPSNSERFTLDSSTFDSDTRSCSFRQEIVEDPNLQKPSKNFPETTFKTISGASVSANSSTARTVTSYDHHCTLFASDPHDRAASFEGTASFSALPLQPVPRGSAQHSGSVSGSLNGFLSGPLERGLGSGPLDRGSGFMSGPLEKGMFMSGPLENTDKTNFSAPLSYDRRRAILGRLVRSVSKPMKTALYRTLSRPRSGWMHRLLWDPVTQFIWNAKEGKYRPEEPVGSSEGEHGSSRNLQWAHGKAGEDRVHVVLSEEHGWLFVGIYDGFNGPDAPDFLMSHLYKAIDKELEGVLWDYDDNPCRNPPESGEVASACQDVGVFSNCEKENEPSSLPFEMEECQGQEEIHCVSLEPAMDQSEELPRVVKDSSNEMAGVLLDGADEMGKLANSDGNSVEDMQKPQEVEIVEVREDESTSIKQFSEQVPSTKMLGHGRKSKRLYELLREEDLRESIGDLHARENLPTAQAPLTSDAEALKCPHGDLREGGGALGVQESDQDNIRVTLSVVGDRQKSVIGSKLTRLYRKQKEMRKKLFRWSYDWDREQIQVTKKPAEPLAIPSRRCKAGEVDHEAVLRALARALEITEEAYMEMVENVLDVNPELVLMGSCVLVMLMKDQDVYVMNLGDSRAVLSQERLNDRHVEDPRHKARSRDALVRVELDRISEESPMHSEISHVSRTNKNRDINICRLKMRAFQLSIDHSTSVEEEVLRVKEEHPDDNRAILNNRVKGQLKVTRAFGAGYLKKPKLNDALMERFRIDYIGIAPYLSCIPHVCHHRLCSNDRFLVLSSDGLYEYFSNEEVVSHVEWFIETVPDGDPAQYLISELLFRAAKKNGMDFHELLDIPHGDRRKYHDDVSVMVVSLEGRIWRSSG